MSDKKRLWEGEKKTIDWQVPSKQDATLLHESFHVRWILVAKHQEDATGDTAGAHTLTLAATGWSLSAIFIGNIWRVPKIGVYVPQIIHL